MWRFVRLPFATAMLKSERRSKAEAQRSEMSSRVAAGAYRDLT
jgi:hypothetical protein